MQSFIGSLILTLTPIVASAKTIDEIIAVVQADIITPITTLFFVIATVFFLYGLVEFITGASNEDARTTGKSHMIWGLTGLLIMSVVWAIISIFQNFFGSIP